MQENTPQTVSLRQRTLQYYYLYGTPLFCLSDYLWGVNIRIPFLETLPVLKYSYYAMSFSCGIFISKFPAKAESVGLAESVSNFIMLVLAFWLTLQNFIGGIIDGTEVSANPFTLNVVLNVVSSGSVFLLSFYNNPIILRMTKDNDKKFRIKK